MTIVLTKEGYGVKKMTCMRSSLIEAIREQQSVEITYEKNSKYTQKRVINPYAWIKDNEKEYIVAYCTWRNDMRVFTFQKVKNISKKYQVF